MTLSNCPQCNQPISNNDFFCPKCGYQLNQRNKIRSENNSSTFQIIALATFVISLFTPMLFLNFFVLIVIVSSIISLVKKEKRKALSVVALLLGFFMLLAPAINESQELEYKDKITIVNWDWNQERNYSYIRGRIRNDGNKIVTYFKIKAYYMDGSGNVLDSDITNDLDDLNPGMSKEFEIMHKHNSEYKTAKVSVDEVRIK
ncbi:MAG: zinc ribbon domain-containing protein [Melioribacteraceae bacterium]|nr:zinc ribbon domain-containing protein [Melioribacteraceae bacterium]MDD3557929.1 FxLYD domain-containing protein [Melioribacteraceae bacterium]